MKETVAKGGWCHPTPRGFVRARVNNTPVLKPDGSASVAIAEALRGVIAGTQTKADAIEHIQNAGVASKHAYKVFSMPVYGGIIRSKLATGDVRAAFDGIITPEEWYRMEAILKSQVKKMRNHDNADFPLTSILFCGECGKAMKSGFGKSRSGKRYGYYWCPQKHGSIRADKTEVLLRDVLANAETAIQEFKSALQLAKGKVIEHLNSVGERREKIMAEIERVKNKKRKLTDRLASGVVGDDDYTVAAKTYDLEVATLTARLNTERDPSDIITEVAQNLGELRNFYDVYTFLDTKQKKHFLKLLLGRIDVDKDKLVKHRFNSKNSGVSAVSFDSPVMVEVRGVEPLTS